MLEDINSPFDSEITGRGALSLPYIHRHSRSADNLYIRTETDHSAKADIKQKQLSPKSTNYSEKLAIENLDPMDVKLGASLSTLQFGDLETKKYTSGRMTVLTQNTDTSGNKLFIF